MKYDEIINNSNLPALKINIDYPQNEIFEELKNIPKKYFVEQIKNDHWKATALRGLSFDKPRPCFEYGYQKEEEVPYIWTEASKKCPITTSFLKKIFGVNLYRVLVRNLKSGGKIHPHRDSLKSSLGISNKTSSGKTKFLILAIYWPKDVIFNIGDYSLPIKTGEAWMINYSLIHEVANFSYQDRYMLTVTGDLDNSEEFRNIVEHSYLNNSQMLFPNKKLIDN